MPWFKKNLDSNNNNFKMELSYCEPAWLDKQLLNKHRLLIIDVRPADLYYKSHIISAMPTGLYSQLLKDRFSKGRICIEKLMGSKNYARYNEYKNGPIVIYLENCEHPFVNDSDKCFMKTFLKVLQENGGQVLLLKDGFESFKNQYPNHCQSDNSADELFLDKEVCDGLGHLVLNPTQNVMHNNQYPKATQPNDPPVEVIPNVFLGNYHNAKSLDCLITHKITYILNVSKDLKNEFENDERFKYRRVPIVDRCSQEILSKLPDAFIFIDEAVHSNTGCLIHCLAGVSRSATICIAYLMKRQQLNFDQAYAKVSAKKSSISPNVDFLLELCTYRPDVHGNLSTLEHVGSLQSPGATADSPASLSLNSLSPQGTTTTTEGDSVVYSSNSMFFPQLNSNAFSSASSTCTTPSPLAADSTQNNKNQLDHKAHYVP